MFSEKGSFSLNKVWKVHIKNFNFGVWFTVTLLTILDFDMATQFSIVTFLRCSHNGSWYQTNLSNYPANNKDSWMDIWMDGGYFQISSSLHYRGQNMLYPDYYLTLWNRKSKKQCMLMNLTINITFIPLNKWNVFSPLFTESTLTVFGAQLGCLA